MRYFLRTVFGLGLMLLCATVMAYALYQLLQVGTCASGGPYEIARECPEGTERLILAFFPAVLGLIAGAVLYGGRGDPPGSEGGGRRVSAWILLWCLIFCGLSFASFWGVWGPDANPGPGGELGGLIVAFLFALMGLAALPFIAPRGGSPFVTTGPAFGTGGGDVVSKLERANRLRAEGALTDAEFEKLKAQILRGGP